MDWDSWKAGSGVASGGFLEGAGEAVGAGGWEQAWKPIIQTSFPFGTQTLCSPCVSLSSLIFMCLVSCQL